MLRDTHKIDYDNYYDKINNMKIWKLFFVAVILIFLFYSVGFCSDMGKVGCAKCCSSCCATLCHAAVLKLDKIMPFSSLVSASSPIPFDTVFHQDPVVRGIDYPPKIIL